MPRWASRLTLLVEGVRVQRLQDITDADAIAEGCPGFNCPPDHNDDTSPQEEFRDLWNSLNARRAPWASNPWVVALTFRAINANIDRLEATP